MSKQYIDKKKAKKSKKIVVRNRSGEVTNTVIPGGLSVGIKGENEGFTVHGDSSFEGTINAERILINGIPVENSATAGANFFFTTNILTVEATPDYANPVSGEDWPTDFAGAPSAKMDGSLSSGTRLTTPGNDYSNTSLGGDSNIDTNEYLVDGSNVTAETDNGTSLTVSLEGHNDLSPRDFRINMKRGSKTVAALRITKDSSGNGNQVLTVADLAQYEDESNSDTFASISIAIPYKLNLGSGIVDLTRVLVIQKLISGPAGSDGSDGSDGAPGAAGSDGSAGTDARAVHLTVSSGKNVIIYDQDGANPAPSSITISATDQNVPDGTDAKFRFLLNDSETQASSATSTLTFSAPSSIDDSSLPLKFEVELREGSGSTVKATDQITIPGVRDGSDAYTVVLENEAHTIPADSSGTVIDPDGAGSLTGYENSGTKIVVYKGATQLTGLTAGSTPSSGEYVVTPAVQQGTITVGSYTVNSDGDVVIPDHASFTSETALISYTINAEGSANITKLQSLTKSRRGVDGVDGADGEDGSDGAAGRTVKLTTTHQAIVYDAAEGNPSPDGETTGQEVTITATAINSSGTPYYRFFKDDSVVQGGSYGGTDSTYSYIPEASYSNMPDKIEVELREGNTSEDPVLARDQITIFGLKPGNDGYSVLLGNEAHTIPANADGTFESGAFAGSGTTLNVFKGTTQLKHTTTSDAGSGFYRYAVSATNISADGSPDTSSSIYEVVYGDAASAGSDSENNDTASIEFTIYAEEGSADGATITKTQTFSKSKRGDNGTNGSNGTDGKTVKLTVSVGKQGIAYSANGDTPNPSSCTILATRFGPSANEGHNVYYRFSIDGTPEAAGFTTGASLSYTPPSSYDDMPDTILVEMGEGTSASNAASNVVAQDEITMFGLKPGEDGADAYTMILTNEAHTLPATTTEAGDATYTGSGTTVRVYKGTTELTAVASSPTATQFTVVAEGTNIDPRGSSASSVSPTSVSESGAVYADHSNMTQNNATITYTVTTGGSGPTLVKVQTLSKSIKGEQGETGTRLPGVDLEIDPPVIIYDTAGNNPDVSEIDLIAVPRNLGNAVNVLNFDGTANARIYQASLSSSNFSFSDGSSTDNPFTVSFWLNVNSDANSSDFQRLYRSWYPFAVGYQSNDMKIALRDETNNETNTFTSAQSSGKDFLEDEEGNWVHVVLAYTPETSNGANNEKIDFYKNGSLWSTHVSPNDSYDHGGLTDNQSYVGWYNGTNSPDMKLSSLLHYNHDGSSGRGSSAFTASDAAAIYNSGFVHTDYTSLTKGDDIVGYWRLDDDPSTNRVEDYSGNNEDFTSISSGVTRDTSSGLRSKSGPSYFTFRVAGSIVGSANQTIPYVSYTSIPSRFSDFASTPKTAVVEMRSENSSDPVDARDQGSITAINPGSNAPVVILDNPVHFFAGAGADGSVSDYSNSGTEIQVYSNGVLLSGLTSTGSAPTTDSGTFQVISRTVTPANRVVLGALSNYTVGTGDDHGDRIIVPDHAQASSEGNRFSKTVGQNAKVTYQINVEGTTVTAVQTLNVNSPGTDGADIGVDVRIDPPLAVVQTDSFGAPTSGALDATAMTVTVFILGDGATVDKATPYADDTFRIEVGDLDSGGFTDGAVSQTTGESSASYSAISAMTADAVYRSVKVHVTVDGVQYTQTKVQQIVKAVSQVDEVVAIIEKPVVALPRTNWSSTYEPTISDYSAADTYIRVYKNGTSVGYHNTADGSMTNNRFKVLVGQSDDFPTINITPGSVSYASSYIANVSSPSGYDNANFPNPAVIDYQVRYKDTVGNFHNIPVRQTMNPVNEYPAEKTFKLGVYHDFGDYPLTEGSSTISTSDAGFFARYATLKTGFNQAGQGRYSKASIIPQFAFTWGLNGKDPSSKGFFPGAPADGNPLEVTGYQRTAGNNVTGYIARNERTSRYTDFTPTNPTNLGNYRDVCAYPGVDIRLVSARGQVYYTNLSWSTKAYYGSGPTFSPVYNTSFSSYAYRDCYFGVDLYTRPVSDNGEGELTYLCTLNMDKTGGGEIDAYANVGGGPDANRAGHRIVSVSDRSSDASTAHDSTHIMKVSSTQQIIPVLWFQKPSWYDRIPKAGFLWFEAEIGYYEI